MLSRFLAVYLKKSINDIVYMELRVNILYYKVYTCLFFSFCYKGDAVAPNYSRSGNWLLYNKGLLQSGWPKGTTMQCAAFKGYRGYV